MPGYLRVGGVVICIAVIAACLSASASTASARSDRRGTTVVDNFQTGRSKTEATGSEPSLLGAGVDQNVLAASTPAEEGARKVAVLLINPPGGFGGTWSAEEARSKVFTGTNSANAFFNEESYGEISLTGKLRADGDVFGWFSVGRSAGGVCPYETWDEEADEAAENSGIDLSGYQNIIYISTLQPSCDWSGIAGVGGSGVNRANINGNAASGVIAHELGHDFGLEHAGSWTCTENGVRVQISDTCSIAEYGDPFDTMGDAAANRHNSGFNLAKLGILGPQNIETVTESGTYSISSALAKTNEPTLLRIARKRAPNHSVTSWYYLEIRQTGGFFERGSDAAMNGVSIRTNAPEGSSPETLLLDANPATASFTDAPLRPGETFDGGRVKFKTISAGAGKATIEVQLNTQPPAAPANLDATVNANGVQLDWTDADSAEVDHYLVYRDGEQVGNVSTPNFLDLNSPAGEREYVVVAVDEEENHSDPSEPLTVDVPAVSGPTCADESCKVAFRYSGAPATWVVPAGVAEAVVTAEGGRGGGHSVVPPEGGGAPGARVRAALGPLTPGQTAEISVGGRGEGYLEGGAEGFNGGGDGGHGGGGGGYTKLELESTLEVLAAGGGGGGLTGHNGSLIIAGGRGGNGSEQGEAGTRGTQTVAMGATLKGGAGGTAGGTGGTAGEGGQVVGSTSCAGGAEAGVSGAAGGSYSGGGGVADGGGGGGGGYVGGGQGGGAASDACGNHAAYGGGGGGSSFAASGFLEPAQGAREDDGWLGLEYADPVVAAAHEYTTPGGEELEVGADRGLLSGSSGPDPGSLSASLVEPPADGSLDLAPDGSFTYLPEAGFTGSDSFVYRVAGSSAEYAEEFVTLNVAGPPSVEISSPSLAETYVVGQAVPTSFLCSEGTAGPGLLSCDDSSGTTTASGGVGQLDTSTEGHHTYTVTAVSEDGLSSEASIEYEVDPAPPPEETPGGTTPGEPSGGTPPATTPAPPGTPTPPGGTEGGSRVELSAAAAHGSLRGLLRTGRLGIRVKVDGAAKLVLSGRARLRVGAGRSARMRLVPVFKPKSTRLAAAGEDDVVLVLTPRGRKALAALPAAKLVIDAAVTAAGGRAHRSLALTLRR